MMDSNFCHAGSSHLRLAMFFSLTFRLFFRFHAFVDLYLSLFSLLGESVMIALLTLACVGYNNRNGEYLFVFLIVYFIFRVN